MTRTTHIGMPLPPFDTTVWHEDVHEAFNLLDAVLYSLTGITNLKGAWPNSTAILLGERYLDESTGELYQCIVAHTSAASPTTFAADRTANPTYWKLIDAGTIASVALLQANDLSDLNSAATARTNLGVAIGSDVQAYDAVLAATTASYTVAEETKLAGIEASADVTDAVNVTAAGALMDSEIASVSSVKLINQRVDTAASPTFNNVTVTSNLEVDNATFNVDTSSNRVGVGTSSPASRLHVVTDDIRGLTLQGATGTSMCGIGFYEIGGNLKNLIDPTSDNFTFSCDPDSHSVAPEIRFSIQGSATCRMSTDAAMFGEYTSNPGQTNLASEAGVWVTKDGRVHAGYVAGFAGQFNRIDEATGNIVNYRCDGVSVGSINYNGTTLAVVTASDAALKENIQDAVGWDVIKALKPRKFRWKADKTHKDRLGFVAQEVQQVLPDAVCKIHDDEETLGIAETALIPHLTSALKKAIDVIETLEARIELLEGKKNVDNRA